VRVTATAMGLAMARVAGSLDSAMERETGWVTEKAKVTD
jgi:hypothetical protein